MRSIVLVAVGILGTVIYSAVLTFAVIGECQPYGDVIFDGHSIDDGLQVKAFIGEAVMATGTTAGGGYSIAIPPDNLETPDKEGWAPGDMVTIQIDGRIATPSFEAFLGSERHDLRIATLDVKLDTWGKIKALFK